MFRLIAASQIHGIFLCRKMAQSLWCKPWAKNGVFAF
jgi:hypothetical protein